MSIISTERVTIFLIKVFVCMFESWSWWSSHISVRYRVKYWELLIYLCCLFDYKINIFVAYLLHLWLLSKSKWANNYIWRLCPLAYACISYLAGNYSIQGHKRGRELLSSFITVLPMYVPVAFNWNFEYWSHHIHVTDKKEPTCSHQSFYHNNSSRGYWWPWCASVGKCWWLVYCFFFFFYPQLFSILLLMVGCKDVNYR